MNDYYVLNMSGITTINIESGYTRQYKLRKAFDDIEANPVECLLLKGAQLRCAEWQRFSEAIQTKSSVSRVSLSIKRLKARELAYFKKVFSRLPNLKQVDLEFSKLTPQTGAILCPSFKNLTHISLSVQSGSKPSLIRLLENININQLTHFALDTNLVDQQIEARAVKFLNSYIIRSFHLCLAHWNASTLDQISKAIPRAKKLSDLQITGKKCHLIADEHIDKFLKAILNSPSLEQVKTHPNLMTKADYRKLKPILKKIDLVGTYVLPHGKRPSYSSSSKSPCHIKNRLTRSQLKKFVDESCLTMHAIARMEERKINLDDVLDTIRNGVIEEIRDDTYTLLCTRTNIKVAVCPSEGKVITVM